jgi:hypothetical protein
MAAVLFAACAVPTDRGRELQIAFDVAPTTMLVGDTARFTVEVTSPSGPVPNAQVEFLSDNDDVVVADPSGLVRGVAEGRATITARLTQYESTPPVTTTMWVSRGILIVDLVPELGEGGAVRYGEELTIVGLRLDPDSLAGVTIGSVPVEIVGYVPREASDPESFERLTVVVPVVRDPQLLVVHEGGGSASRGLPLTPEDLLEVFGFPVPFDLADGPVIERHLTVGDPDSDWYRFDLPAGDWTFDLTLAAGYAFTENAQLHFDLRAPSLVQEWFPEWARDQWFYACDLPGRFNGFWAAPRREAVGALVIPVRTSVPMTIDFVSFTEQDYPTVPYRLLVTPGYHSDAPPDAAEGNDFCHQAASVGVGGTAADYTFDTPTDHDWYEFTIPGTPADFTTIRRDEVESNDAFGSADPVTTGSRIVGVRQDAGDIDYFAVDLVAGTLLDVDVRSRLLPEGSFGRTETSRMRPDLVLYDSAGTSLARAGTSPTVPTDSVSRGSDARIRWFVPVTGRYYLSLTGTSSSSSLGDFGSHMYYAMDVWAHQPAGTVAVEVVASPEAGDPDMIVIERRPDGNVMLDRLFAVGAEERATLPVTGGSYYLLTYSATAKPGSYTLAVTHTPPSSAAGTSGASR